MRFILFLLALTGIVNGYAQKQNNNWCMGNNVGITFNNFPPTTFTPVFPFASIASATVSHRNTGALLLYANLYKVYNRNYQVTPNGTNISSALTAGGTQGVNIVPFINDTNKYYLFTLTGLTAAPVERGVLSYSVVDMTLDAGLGDVVAGQKNIPIDSGFASGMVVAEGCDSYWLILHKRISGDFYAYKITASGINTTPVISKTAYSNKTGGTISMKISPDRRSLSLTSFNYLTQALYPADTVSYIAMHDFNAFTGKVTHGRVIDTLHIVKTPKGFYSCEFSPDSRRLYVTAIVIAANSYVTHQIYQYDLNQPIPAIAAFKGIVYSSSLRAPGALQMGPDNNIYTPLHNTDGINHSMARISNANAPFPSCTFTVNAIPVIGPTYLPPGLPQAVVNPLGIVPAGVFITCVDTAACLKQPVVLHTTVTGSSFEWQDGSKQSSFTVTQTGTYWVRYSGPCGLFIDTFVVKNLRDTASISSDTIICKNGSMILKPVNTPPNATYLWNTGSTNNQITIVLPGQYQVTTTEICNVTIDSINVTAVAVTATVTNADTTLCYGDTLLLSGIVNPAAATIKWSTGDIVLNTKASAPARYTLTAEFTGCKASDYVDVLNYPRIMIDLGEDREICGDEPVTLPVLVTSEQSDKYLWQDGSTGRTFHVSETGRYTVHVTNRCGTVSDTVNIVARNCDLFFPSVFSPNGDGRNDIARLLGDIANVSNYELHIFHRWGEEMFASNDISTGWDGTYKGQPAEQATYYYFIKYKYFGNDKLMKGDLVLLR